MSDFWIQTVSGKAFDLLDPQPDMIDLDDIAHALSQLCRFTGHVPGGIYSVAQHSCFVSDNLPTPELRRAGLLHDAAEAYVSDLSNPLKCALRSSLFDDEARDGRLSTYDVVEARIQGIVCFRFGLSRIPHPEVAEADLRALATEARDLLAPPPRRWEALEGVQPFEQVIHPFPWTANEAKRRFLARAAELGIR